MKTVKTIETIHKDIDAESYTEEIINYNENGDIIMSKKFDPEGNVIEKTITNYNDDGKKISEKQYTSDEDIAEVHFFEYDDKNKLKSEQVKYAEGYESNINYIRNEEKKELLIEETDEDGEIEEYKIIKFDDKGNVTQEADYDDMNKLKTAVKYYHDDNDRLIKREDYELKMKKPIVTREYTYHDNGEIESMIIRNRKGKVVDKFNLEYDDKNRLVMQSSPESGTIVVEHDDDYHRKEKIADAAGNIKNETEYVYNDNGHLIKEKTPLIEKEYKITYY